MDRLSDTASPGSGRGEGLRTLEPRAIGATGGSGTRVVARIVRAGGMYIGTNLNDYQDSLDLAGFSDRWINSFVESGLDGLDDARRGEMAEDLERVFETHRRDEPPDATAWGWKEPRSIYLVPFFDSVMPGFRFLHFLRDGRDMAFSENQQQLRKHGDVVLGNRVPRWKKRVRSITLWSLVNTQAADYGEQHMSGRYLRVRFEDLCGDPVATVGAIYDFFDLEGDVEQAAAEVRPPGTLGRWKSARGRTVAALHEAAGPALERLGYAVDS